MWQALQNAKWGHRYNTGSNCYNRAEPLAIQHVRFIEYAGSERENNRTEQNRTEQNRAEWNKAELN
jgi:hypothetical protein